MSPAPSSRFGRIISWAVLVAAVLVAYYPALHGGILWDDDAHVTKTALRTVDGLRRIWFELGATQQYYPLVHSAFWLQARLWGDHFVAYHVLNVVLHATSAFLVLLILRRLAVPGAVLAATIFALHPVHVESVAWMTELKNTLSGTLYLGALLAYVEFDTSRAARAYRTAVILFVLALLSKTVTATLPAAVLVILWWQRGRIHWRRDVVPLVPFFVAGAIGGVTTAWVEHTFIGATGGEFTFSLVERGLIAGRAFLFYLGKLVWPANLIFIYPRWAIDAGAPAQYVYPIVAAALLVVAWSLRRQSRAPLAGLLFFAITLGPALGFVNVYPFRYAFVADHFQYLSSLGIIALGGATLAWLGQQVPSVPKAVTEGTLVVLLALPLALLTWRQSHLYANAVTLYEETLRGNPAGWLAHLNLGALEPHDPAGIARAIEHYRAALAINPDEAQVRNNLGTSLMEQGRYEDALREHREAVRIAPAYAEAYLNLGADLQHLGRYEEAEAAYRSAMRFKPQLAASYYNLGVVLHLLGRSDEARVAVGESLRLDPGNEEARRLSRDVNAIASRAERSAAASTPAPAEDQFAATTRLGATLIEAGRFADAVTQYEQAVRLAPRSEEALSGLGYALWRSGHAKDAERELRAALEIYPDNIAMRDTLGNALQSQQRVNEAVAEYERALAGDAGTHRADILNDLGVALARLGRRDDAIRRFREAVALVPGHTAARTNLSKALAGSP